MSRTLHGRAHWVCVYLLPPFLYMALIFGLSSIERWGALPPALRAQDKSIHLLEYGLLGWLWYRALAPTSMHATSCLLIATLLSGIYGLTDEAHQYHVPGRYADPYDVLANFTGALVGAALGRWRLGG